LGGPLHILVVQYDIVPAEIDKYLTAIKELGVAAVKELGCRLARGCADGVR